MHIYFLRHAEAEDLAPTDAARKLTLKGKQQADKVAKFCIKNAIAPELILSSPFTRALQTAKILSRKLGRVELLTCKWIACGMTPDVFLTEIRGYGTLNEVVIVGHEPDFSSTISRLLGSTQSSVNVRKASLICVNLLNISGGTGFLDFSVPVRLM